MNKMASFKPVLGIGLLAWLASGELWATDGYRELQITQDIDARTSPGEVVRLQASGLEFQGLYREAVSKNVRGAVVLLHGRDSNQDAADLIRPLRRGCLNMAGTLYLWLCPSRFLTIYRGKPISFRKRS